MSERTQFVVILVITAFVFGAAAWELVRGLIVRHEQRKADEWRDAWERARR